MYQIQGSGALTVPAADGAALFPLSVDNILFADQYPTLPAAISALTAGCILILPANTTYTLSSTLTIAQNNVRIMGQGWGTVIQRAGGFTSQLVSVTGSGVIVENLTIDGNSVSSSSADFGLSGANSVVRFCQFINGVGSIQLALSGANSAAINNTITGTGATGSQTYGIWAIGTSDPAVLIQGNTITSTSIDAIGVHGNGSRILGNYISGCHTYTGEGGGQLALYPNTGTLSAGLVVANNFIGQGGGSLSHGIENNSTNVSILGNEIFNQEQSSLVTDQNAVGMVVTGNSMINCGLANPGSVDAISIYAAMTDFVISGNRIADVQGSPTMRYAVHVPSGASDRYVITGNLCRPSGELGSAISDSGSGSNKYVSGNVV